MKQYVIILKPDKILLVYANNFNEAVSKVEKVEKYDYMFNAFEVEKVIH